MASRRQERQAETRLQVMRLIAQNPEMSTRQIAEQYGIIRPGDTPGSVAGLVEKPQLEDAPSRVASIGRYVLEPEILDILANTLPGASGEIQLADAINLRAQQGHVNAVSLSGARYDCGSKFGYLEAIVDFALDHADYGPAFRALIAQRARGGVNKTGEQRV